MGKRSTFQSECTKVVLECGEIDSRVFIDIEPTMKNITHGGKRYFQCRDSRVQDPSDGRWAMMYLWEGWGEWKMKQLGISPTNRDAGAGEGGGEDRGSFSEGGNDGKR